MDKYLMDSNNFFVYSNLIYKCDSSCLKCKMATPVGSSESRNEGRLLRVKRSEKEHIFALTGETPKERGFRDGWLTARPTESVHLERKTTEYKDTSFE